MVRSDAIRACPFERQMRARCGVVLDVRVQHASQAGCAQDDHVIKALTTNGSDEPLDVGVLPG